MADEDVSRAVIDAVLAGWREHGVPFLPSAGRVKLDAFETLYELTLPPDLRLFFERTDGTHVPLNPGNDHQYYEFYRLSELARHERWSWAWNFADYLMISWWFAIDLGGKGPHGKYAVYMMGGDDESEDPFVVAHSFTEFLQLYLADDPRLMPPGAKAYAKAKERRDR